MADRSFHHEGFVIGSLGGPQFDPRVRKIPWRRAWQSTSVFLDLPGGSDGIESACNVGDLGSIPGSGRSLGGGHGNPRQYSCLENPTDRGARQATVHGVAKSRTRLSDLACTQFGVGCGLTVGRPAVKGFQLSSHTLCLGSPTGLYGLEKGVISTHPTPQHLCLRGRNLFSTSLAGGETEAQTSLQTCQHTGSERIWLRLSQPQNPCSLPLNRPPRPLPRSLQAQGCSLC